MERLRLAIRLAIAATLVAVLAGLDPTSAQEIPENQDYLSGAALGAPIALPATAPAPIRRSFYDKRVAERLHRDAARLPSVVDRPDEGLGLADSVIYRTVHDDAERVLAGATRRAVRNYLLEVSGIESFRQQRFGGSSSERPARRGLRPLYDLRLSDDSARLRVGLRGARSKLHFDLGTDGELGLGWRLADRFSESTARLRYLPEEDELWLHCRFSF